MTGSVESPLAPPAIPAVSAVLVRDQKVLLVRRGRAPARGLYAFPGGRVEPGETLEYAVRRELREETGLVAQDATPFRELTLGGEETGAPVFALTVFIVAGVTGALAAGDDAADAAWFSLDELTALPVTESTLVIARELLGSAAG